LRQSGQHEGHVCRNFPWRESRSAVRSRFSVVSRDVARGRKCPPVPKCTRLVPARTPNLAIAGNARYPFAGLSSSPLTDSNRRPLLTIEVQRRHARTRAITPDTISPANRTVAGGGDASRDVARVVSDVSVCVRVASSGLTTTCEVRSPRVRAASCAREVDLSARDVATDNHPEGRPRVGHGDRETTGCQLGERSRGRGFGGAPVSNLGEILNLGRGQRLDASTPTGLGTWGAVDDGGLSVACEALRRADL
jgi:hypothetical protein